MHAAYFTVQVSVTSPIFVIKAKETSHSHSPPTVYLANATNNTLTVSMEDEYEYKHVALLGLFSILQIIILEVAFLPTSATNDQQFNALAEDYL